jgi:hypothetical protein
VGIKVFAQLMPFVMVLDLSPPHHAPKKIRGKSMKLLPQDLLERMDSA